MFGLVPIGSLSTLMVDPSLPPWLPDMILRDLRVGDAKVTLRFGEKRAAVRSGRACINRESFTSSASPRQSLCRRPGWSGLLAFIESLSR
jgi:hypothetical protein